ncbi:hypothetical protein LTR37_011361 [Vermiconidia calcicola]|uniref:Uncharacterized protein n=1 Tax=Vermiconidia calcicola TaxID=1690605 RepID=A0ACC3N2F8_9PEZI|nr:hypothetical protein LTR37_011361 [Vermiconidia calcicola]
MEFPEPPLSSTAGSMATIATQLPAASRVFGTTELLEDVLKEMPTTTLIRSTRVCRIWKKVIERSASLRMSLFLTEAPTSPVLQWSTQSRRHPTIIETCDVTDSSQHWIVEVNPFFTVSEYLDPFFKPTDNLDDPHLKMAFKVGALLNFARTRWSNMFITQPPLHWIGFELDDSWTFDPDLPIEYVKKEGITIKDVAQVLHSCWAEECGLGCRESYLESTIYICAHDVIPADSSAVALAKGRLTSEEAVKEMIQIYGVPAIQGV